MSTPGQLPPPTAGGGGTVGAAQFEPYIESLWVTVFIFFILWVVGLFIAPLLQKFSKQRGGGGGDGMGARAANFTRGARDGLLILLVLTLVTMAGHGPSGGVIAIQWVLLGLLLVWCCLQAAHEIPWFTLPLVALPIAVLAIINYALAFRGAPSYY
ncbi:hypothetical protein SeMB42_g01388 [Synchytrium endobioticum]|uniref:Transmembrane protein n=1 Tax=Synchytrium endobioticum TaxID=286115 RepID=A0A507DEY5_9FUNG|nr:hypothetical protein SeLEV6574_g01000 [Synchytrium endobioticum]TPX52472.1 hypothetical protein SeMB42_g01388 [Synchytrium endobioticum]